MNTYITAGNLHLHPLTAAQAHDIAATGRLPQPLQAAEGWPHADSYDGLRLATDNAYTWLITLDNLVIGDCGTLGGPTPNGDIEIGYGLAEPYRGRGNGTTLVKPLADFLLTQPGINRVVAETIPTNRPSYRVLERAGFQRTHTSDDKLHYAYP